MGAQILVLIIALIIKGAVSADKHKHGNKRVKYDPTKYRKAGTQRRTSLNDAKANFGVSSSRTSSYSRTMSTSQEVKNTGSTYKKSPAIFVKDEYEETIASPVKEVKIDPVVTPVVMAEELVRKEAVPEKAETLEAVHIDVPETVYSNYGEVKFDMPNVDTSFGSKVDFDLPSLGGEMEESKDEVVDSILNSRDDSIATPAQKLKFTITTLVYVMYEDDGNFSKKEKKLVKMMLKQSKGTLQAYDIESIERLLETRPNLDSVMTTMETSNLTTYDALDIVKTLRKTLRKQQEYDRVLSRIENRISLEY